MPHPLASWRFNAGLTQAQLAERVNVTRGTIANIEAGRQWPHFRLMDELVRLTGVDPNTFYERQRGTFRHDAADAA